MGNLAPPRFGSLDPQTKLKVFFVTDEDIRPAGDLMKYLGQGGLPVFPERSAEVQIKGNLGTVFLGGFGYFDTEFSG